MMRKLSVIALASLFAATASASVCALDVQAQKNRQPKQANDNRNIDKFSGMGSYEAYQSSLPEVKEGWKFYNGGQYDQAINKFRAAVALYPNQPKCYMGIGQAIEAKGGDPAEAEIAYKKSLDLDSTDFRVWKKLTNVLYQQKKFGEARQSISSALQAKVTPRQRQEMDTMIQTINSAERNAPINTPN